VRLGVVLGVAAVLFVPSAGAAVRAAASNCAHTSVPMTPLTDLGARRYHGFPGGLYGRGKNTPPHAYLRTGIAAAKRVRPIDGKVVLLSIGMSNATLEFSTFEALAAGNPLKSPAVTIVDGAQDGQDAETVKDPGAPYWSVVDARLAAAGATDAQVQAIWLKEAIANQHSRFPQDARRLEADLRATVGVLRSRFPNLQLVYVSSRTYAGYASTALNPEPQAYDSGFAAKWLVEQRIDGKLRGPWIGWGPYLWTDGLKGRKDGLVWTCQDVRATDGTHPSTSGRAKVAALLWQFFASDPTARGWFLAPPTG
jgi:hypothetical protein